MNVNHIKRKIDIEKYTLQKYTRFTSNKLCCNELIIYYIICETLKSNFVTKLCKRVNHTWCKRSESFWQTLHHFSSIQGEGLSTVGQSRLCSNPRLSYYYDDETIPFQAFLCKFGF